MSKKLKQKEVTARDMERFAPVPADYEDFAADAAEKFLFYSRKDGICYCPHCHENVGWYPVSHNVPTICPKCGRHLTAKSIGYSRKTPEYTWTMMFQPDGQNVLTRYFLTTTDWRDYLNPAHVTQEMHRLVHTPFETRDYMWWYPWGDYSKKKWVKFRKRGMGYSAYSSVQYEPDYSTPYNLSDDVLKGTAFQYSCLKEMLSVQGLDTREPKDFSRIRDYTADIWLNVYRQAPYIEALYKVGFRNLVRHAAQNEYNRRLYSNKRSVIDVLKVDRARYRLLLQRGDPTHKELETLQKLPESVSYEDWLFASKLRMTWNGEKLFDKLNGVLPLGKVNRYFTGNNINPDEYSDYFGWLDELHYPREDYYFFPKNFGEAHDRVSLEYARVKCKLEDEKIQRYVQSLSNIEAFKMHYGGLMVIVADSAEALRREGQILHHCVGTYVNKVARGETTILFVRRESEPDVPFYTMEFRNGRVTQLYGSHDCQPTQELIDFRTEFERRARAELKVA